MHFNEKYGALQLALMELAPADAQAVADQVERGSRAAVRVGVWRNVLTDAGVEPAPDELRRGVEHELTESGDGRRSERQAIHRDRLIRHWGYVLVTVGEGIVAATTAFGADEDIHPLLLKVVVVGFATARKWLRKAATRLEPRDQILREVDLRIARALKMYDDVSELSDENRQVAVAQLLRRARST